MELHDGAKILTHTHTHTHTHTQLISEALNSLVHGPEFATIDGHESLTRRIAALHVVYHFARPHVFWFGQLVSHLPGIMTTLEDKLPDDDSEMVRLCDYLSTAYIHSTSLHMPFVPSTKTVCTGMVYNETAMLSRTFHQFEKQL